MVPLLLQALIDSGADANFVDVQPAKELDLNLQPLPHPIQVRSLNNQLLHQFKFQTQPVLLSIENHTEKLIFLVLETSSQPLVLGIPWLARHNPHIDWCT